MYDITVMVILRVLAVMCLTVPLVGLMWMFWDMIKGKDTQ